MANVLVSAAKSEVRPFTVLVEGNIGSGKTTFLNHFKKFGDICLFTEPVQLWQNLNGYNLLALMYENTNRWGFSFQSYVLLTMLRLHTQETTCPIKLMERSIYSARYCFIEKMSRDRKIPEPSIAVLDEWFKWSTTEADTSVDLIVYLRTSPEVVYDRMIKRNRSEEQKIPLEYLKSLHTLHEDWLYNKTSFTCPAPVITLNADLDLSLIREEYEKFEPCILNKIVAQA